MEESAIIEAGGVHRKKAMPPLNPGAITVSLPITFRHMCVLIIESSNQPPLAAEQGGIKAVGAVVSAAGGVGRENAFALVVALRVRFQFPPLHHANLANQTLYGGILGKQQSQTVSVFAGFV